MQLHQRHNWASKNTTANPWLVQIGKLVERTPTVEVAHVAKKRGRNGIPEEVLQFRKDVLPLLPLSTTEIAAKFKLEKASTQARMAAMERGALVTRKVPMNRMTPHIWFKR